MDNKSNNNLRSLLEHFFIILYICQSHDLEAVVLPCKNLKRLYLGARVVEFSGPLWLFGTVWQVWYELMENL